MRLLPCFTLLLVACPGGLGGGGAPSPQVTLTVQETVIVAPTLPFEVKVTGCDAVTNVEISDRGKSLRGFPITGISELLPAEISFKSGLSAELQLSAKITCEDGRTGESAVVPVRFFPVEESLPAAGLPDSFYAESEGPTVTFVGCAGGVLERRARTGLRVGAMTSAPFPCSNAAIISEPNSTSGKRWLLEPGVGAYAFDSNFRISAIRTGRLHAIAVGPDGDAVLWDSFTVTEAIVRVRASDGALVWPVGTQPDAFLTGNPIIFNNEVYVPIWISPLAATQPTGTVALEILNYNTGVPRRRNDLMVISYPFLDPPPVPATAFNSAGTSFYVPAFETGTSTVFACTPTTAPCVGTAQWTRNLGGTVKLVVPYAGDTRLAAVTPTGTYFLDAMTGQILSPQVAPPGGGMTSRSVLPGRGFASSTQHPEASCGATPCEDIYLFNGPATGGALEVIAFDSPTRGPVFRLQIPNGTVTGAVDDGGELWLRVGDKRVRPMSLSQYRTLAGN
ncbi:MAG: hypothetical protein ACT4TC_00910 [Myxococcaceae bacterium]